MRVIALALMLWVPLGAHAVDVRNLDAKPRTLIVHDMRGATEHVLRYNDRFSTSDPSIRIQMPGSNIWRTKYDEEYVIMDGQLHLQDTGKGKSD